MRCWAIGWPFVSGPRAGALRIVNIAPNAVLQCWRHQLVAAQPKAALGIAQGRADHLICAHRGGNHALRVGHFNIVAIAGSGLRKVQRSVYRHVSNFNIVKQAAGAVLIVKQRIIISATFATKNIPLDYVKIGPHDAIIAPTLNQSNRPGSRLVVVVVGAGVMPSALFIAPRLVIGAPV